MCDWPIGWAHQVCALRWGVASVGLFRARVAVCCRGRWPGVFVGRAAELGVLEAAAAARDGQPAVVLVEGEAGIGKSALLARFASGLPGTTVLRASGDEAELRLPYRIVSQLVASELNEGVDPLAVGAELVTRLGQAGLTRPGPHPTAYIQAGPSSLYVDERRYGPRDVADNRSVADNRKNNERDSRRVSAPAVIRGRDPPLAPRRVGFAETKS